MTWTLDRVAEALHLASRAYHSENGAAIVTVAISAGMSEEQIFSQLQQREDLNAALSEWDDMEDDVCRRVVNEMQVSRPPSIHHSQGEAMNEMERRVNEEREKFLVSRGVK